jgi:hypothetical protein
MDKLMFYLLNDDNDGIICGIPSMIPTKVTDGMPPPSQIIQPFEAKVGKTRMIGEINVNKTPSIEEFLGLRNCANCRIDIKHGGKDENFRGTFVCTASKA